MKKELTRQQYLDLYYYMRLNRAVEDMMVKLFRQNKIVGGFTPVWGRKRYPWNGVRAGKKGLAGAMIRNIGRY